jgi:hypothetical protein
MQVWSGDALRANPPKPCMLASTIVPHIQNSVASYFPIPIHKHETMNSVA